MDKKIQVFVDIYLNKLSEESVYANIRAIDKNEQAAVDETIKQMMLGDNKGLLLDSDTTIWRGDTPYQFREENRKCLFNITQQNFEFEE